MLKNTVKIGTGLFLVLSTFNLFSQNVAISPTIVTPAPSAMLDVSATNKGVLLPRIGLTSATDVITIPSPATSLLIYNTTTSGVIPNNVTSGYYYWNGTKWTPFGGFSDDWSLTGNTGTTAGTNFLGTTSCQS